MTNPFGGTGASSDVGTATGKVRIEYESVGAPTVVSEVQRVQQAVEKSAASMDALNRHTRETASGLSGLGGHTGNGFGTSASSGISGHVSAMTRAIEEARRYGSGLTFDGIPMRFDMANVRDQAAAAKRIVQQEFSRNPINFKINVEETTRSGGGHSGSGGMGFIFDILSGRGGSAMSVMRTAGAGMGEALGGGIAGGLATAGAGAALGGIALAATGVVAAVGAAGYALKAGFERQENIDSAATKMRALGYTTQQVQSIMKSALDSVNGTAFSLDEAAQTAVQAMAAGVKGGDTLTNYLKDVANTAALAKMSMADMGYYFNQVATQGHLEGNQLQELQQRGVPILKYLADEYGVTQQKASEMVSAGQVDFAHFEEAMHNHVGGIATTMGESISGAIDNLKTSVARLGAAFLAPIFGGADGQMSNFAKGVEAVQHKIDELAGTLKTHGKGLVDFWADMGEGALMGAHITVDAIDIIMHVVGDAAKAVGALIRGAGDVAGFFGAHGVDDNLHKAAAATNEWGNATNRNGNKLYDFNHQIDQGWNALNQWRNKAKDAVGAANELGGAFGDVAPKAITVGDALEKLNIKSDDAAKKMTGNSEQFQELLAAMVKANASKDLIDTVTRLHNEYNQTGRAAEEYKKALDGLGDSSQTAEEKSKNLLKALQDLNTLPNQDATQNLDDAIRKATDYQSNLVDHLDVTGNSLVNMNGTINTTTKNGSTLVTQIKDIRQAMYAMAASGQGNPAEIWERSDQALTVLLGKFGIVGPAAQDIINKYLLPEKDFEIIYKATNEPEVKRELTELITQLDDAKNQGKTQFSINVDPANAAQLQDVLQKLGVQWNQYDPQTKTAQVTVPPDARAKVQQALDGIFGGDPSKIPSTLDIKTTQDDILKTIVGQDGVLHIPTVLDIPAAGQPGGPPGTPGAPGAPAGPPPPPPGPNQPGAANVPGSAGHPGPNVAAPKPGGGQFNVDDLTKQGWKNVAGQGQSPLLVPTQGANPPQLGPGNAAPDGWYWEFNDPNMPKGVGVLTPSKNPAPGSAGYRAPAYWQPGGRDIGKPALGGGNWPHGVDAEHPQGMAPWKGADIFNAFNNMLHGTTPDDKQAPYTLNDPLKASFNDPAFIQKAFAQNPDLAKTLQPFIDKARSQGKSFSDAFAEGVNGNDDAIKQAIIKLAQLAGDGLGASPAKYGPLSGTGWTLYRGQNFTTAWAQGIASQTKSVAGASTSVAQASIMPLDDQVTGFVKDAQALVHLAQGWEGLASQVAGIGLSFAGLFNTMSGGRLFPKNYYSDPTIDPRRNPLGTSWNPGQGQLPGGVQNPWGQGNTPGGTAAAPAGLGPNAGKQDIVNYIMQKAMSLGYSQDQAKSFAVQAAGESHYDPNAYNPAGWSGIFQFDQPTWQSAGGGDMRNAQQNIDNYFRLAQQRGLTPQSFTDPSQLGTQVSIGGPLHPKNAKDLAGAQSFAAPFIAGFKPTGVGGPNPGVAVPLPTGQINAGMPGANTNYNPDWMVQHGFPALFHKSGADATQAEIPPWLHAIADRFGLTISSHADRTLHGGQTGKGNTLDPSGSWAVDIGGPGADPAKMEALAQFLQQNYAGDIAQLIHRSGTTDYGIAGGQNVGGPRGTGTYYTDGEGYSVHGDHVHVAFARPLAGVPVPQGVSPPAGRPVPPAAPQTPVTPPAPPAGPARWMPVTGKDGKQWYYMKSPTGDSKGDRWLPPGIDPATIEFTADGLPKSPDGQMWSNSGILVPTHGTQAFTAPDRPGTFTPQPLPSAPAPTPAPPGGQIPGTQPNAPQPSANAPDGSPQQPLNVVGPDGSPWSGQPSPGQPTGAMGDLLAQHPEIMAVVGGAGDRKQAITALQSIDGLLADQNKIVDAAQGRAKLGFGGPVDTDPQAVIAKELQSQLGSMKSNIQQQYGLAEGQSGLEQAQSMLSGASGIASDVFQTVDAYLQAVSATQNATDILVRGVANTKDVSKLIDDFQTYITVASKIFQTAGDITSFAGSFTGGADFGGASAAGQGLSLIGQALAAINTGIDMAQETYQLTMKYVGRFLTSWLGFPGAQDMNFLLDQRTGQLMAYTSANPDQKTTFNTLGRMGNQGAYVDARTQPTNNFVIYQGPGQDPRDTMNDAMFAVRSSGVGAFGYDAARPA